VSEFWAPARSFVVAGARLEQFDRVTGGVLQQDGVHCDARDDLGAEACASPAQNLDGGGQVIDAKRDSVVAARLGERAEEIMVVVSTSSSPVVAGGGALKSVRP
jgi:hypothetical protein